MVKSGLKNLILRRRTYFRYQIKAWRECSLSGTFLFEGYCHTKILHSIFCNVYSNANVKDNNTSWLTRNCSKHLTLWWGAQSIATNYGTPKWKPCQLLRVSSLCLRCFLSATDSFQFSKFSEYVFPEVGEGVISSGTQITCVSVITKIVGRLCMRSVTITWGRAHQKILDYNIPSRGQEIAHSASVGTLSLLHSHPIELPLQVFVSSLILGCICPPEWSLLQSLCILWYQHKLTHNPYSSH